MDIKVGNYVNVQVWPPPNVVKELFVISIKGDTVRVVDLFGNKKDININSIVKVY